MFHSELLSQYLTHRDNQPVSPLTQEWRDYWNKKEKNPNVDEVPEMFTEEFTQYSKEGQKIWNQLSFEDKKKYWDLLKEKNHDQWEGSSNNPEGKMYDILCDYRSLIAEQLGFSKSNPMTLKKERNLYLIAEQLGFSKSNPIKTPEDFNLYMEHVIKMIKN